MRASVNAPQHRVVVRGGTQQIPVMGSRSLIDLLMVMGHCRHAQGSTGPETSEYEKKIVTRVLTSKSGQTRSELHWGGQQKPKKKCPYGDIHSKYWF